ncbi:ceramidase [Globomyces pollinis-pini]|nr:ceramidase [Globomyces pollinis-pini]
MSFNLHRSIFPIDPANKQGVWGPATSTLDWCEENYKVSPYVAEWWNTVSNLNYFALCVLGFWSCYRTRAEMRNYVTLVLANVIGLGSLLFHMTLTNEMQLLDELPMIYATASLVYCAFNMFHDHRKSTGIGLTLYCLMSTIHYVTTRNFRFFQASYGLLVLATLLVPLGQIYILSTKHPYASQKVFRLFLLNLGAYLTGFILWNIDNSHCDQLRNIRESFGGPVSGILQLHAWWHMFTGLGALGSCQQVHYMRLLALGRKDIDLKMYGPYTVVVLKSDLENKTK